MPGGKKLGSLEYAYQEALRLIDRARQSADSTLYLNNLGLSAIPPEIAQLTTLTHLEASFNRLTTLPPEIGRLTALTHLFLFDNQITALPPEIGQLTALTELGLGINQLVALPPEVGQLTALTRLYLPRNQLAALPPEIGRLTALSELYLAHNQLAALPSEMAQLTALTQLGLSDNRLAALPPEIQHLHHVRTLFLHGNESLGLPPEVLGPTWQEVVRHRGEPASPREILRYYFRLHPPPRTLVTPDSPGAAQPLNEAKVLVVGEPGVGKTALVHWLVHDKPLKNPEWTKGIRIDTWAVPCAAAMKTGPIRVNVWDFGGQEIMQATHQFFLTERSLYLLVLDSRENEEQSKIRYWLDKIRAFGGDSPVIVVLNKRDEGKYEPDESRLRQDYAANLLDPFFRTACKKGVGVEAGHGVAELREVIMARVRQLENVRKPVPAEYLRAKAAFEKQSAKLKRMDRGRFATICRQSGLTEEIDHDTLLSYLKSLGSLFHYERAGRDSKTLVLDPAWLTAGVYKIITDLELRERSAGVLTPKDIPRIFRHSRLYPPQARSFILEMMEGDPFELCFRIPDTDDHRLIPELLPPSEPTNHGITPANSLNLQYHYRYLPAGLIPRFIVRMHNVVSPGDYWRNGAILRIDGRRVLVRGSREEAKVFISVEKREPAARRALAVVRHNLDIVHGAMKHLSVEERVPLPDQPDVTVSCRYLLERERDEGPSWPWTPEGARRRYRIRELLEGIEEPTRRLGPDIVAAPDAVERVAAGAPVFISYAHENSAHAESVRRLADNLRECGVDAFLDQYIGEMGPDVGWPLWMHQRIEEAEIVLMVCSPAYLRRVEGKEEPGTGLGATYEGKIIRQMLYQAGVKNMKFRAVTLSADHEVCVPRDVEGFTRFPLYLEGGFERLYRALTGQPHVIAPPLGQPRILPPAL